MGLWEILKGEEPSIFHILLNYKNAGQYGEYATEFALGKNNLDGYYKTVHNVYISHKGKTTEIDVIMIHERGVFVFESKNYSGWIFGNIDQNEWTQCLQSGIKNRFYNPLKQNATHCAALANFFNIFPGSIYSYIVFSQRCELKNVPDNTLQYTIVHRHNLLKVLRQDLSDKTVLFTHLQVDELTKKLQDAANITSEQKQQHVEDIKAIKFGTICPFCGAQLVIRKGNYGNFYGCSTYPKCKFTRKI